MIVRRQRYKWLLYINNIDIINLSNNVGHINHKENFQKLTSYQTVIYLE